MKYAVIRLQGHQYKVSEGEEILVDKINGEPEVQVLLTVDEEKVNVGNPTVKGAKVALKISGDEKGEKLDVFKFKSKSRYRKHTGFRASLTKLTVESISF